MKFKRESFREDALGTHNRYVVPSRFGSLSPRRRLLVIYLGIMVFSIFLLAFHFVSQSVSTQWLPLEYGSGRIMEKFIEGEGTAQAEYWIRVEVLVPGEDSEALVLSDEILLTQVDWDSVEPGEELGVEYRVDREQGKLLIDGLAFEDIGGNRID